MRNCGAFVILLLMSSGALNPAHAAGETVHILGCVVPGEEAGCLIIKDRKTGESYQINSANPRPDPAQNLVVDLKGQIFRGVDICMQGPILKEVIWSYTKLRCADQTK